VWHQGLSQQKRRLDLSRWQALHQDQAVVLTQFHQRWIKTPPMTAMDIMMTMPTTTMPTTMMATMRMVMALAMMTMTMMNMKTMTMAAQATVRATAHYHTVLMLGVPSLKPDR
jgi:hypothetical protein